MRVALFGLTGYGTSALRALHAAGIDICALVTRRESGPFPYYDCEQIADVAAALNVPVIFEPPRAGDETFEAVTAADALVVASYHRKIAAEVITAFPLAINAHPSLLPLYRGATPELWAIRNGDTESGVTIHYLDSTFDTGDIIDQRRLQLRPDETHGSLRERLARIAGDSIVQTLTAFSRFGALPRRPQNGRASEGRRPIDRERTIDSTRPAAEIERIIRAFAPYPGALLDDGGTMRVVRGLASINTDASAHLVDAADGSVAVHLAGC
ncbi:MAG: methionyl-tRNA formyltransferase [Candidatus Velthaea sp.]